MLIHICLFLLAFYFIIYVYSCSNDCNYYDNIEDMIDIPKYQNNEIIWNKINCRKDINNTYKNVFEINKINKYNNYIESANDWVLHLPCSYNNVKDEMDKAKKILKKDVAKNNDKRIFMVNNIDDITRKDSLWVNLVKYYSIEEVKKISPNSYVLNNFKDLMRFKKEYDKNKVYILKKNIQRQKGLKITNNFYDIFKGFSGGYIIAQELLQDTYLIDNRKINLRVYLLIICYKNNYTVHMFNDGFVYYTKDKFEKNSLKSGPNITTGYIDRKVYEKNPLTHQDFIKYLDNPNRILTDDEKNLIKNNKIKNENDKLGEYTFKNIKKLFIMIFNAYHKNFYPDKKFKNNVFFQLLGADIGLDSKLNPKIIEFNKGPDVSGKDGRDLALKTKLISDALRMVGILDHSDDNGFEEIIDVDI